MPLFKVIEGTVWEVNAGTIEDAKATFTAFIKGDENALNAVREIEGSSYWYGEEYSEGIIDALSELADVFEGVSDTDLWNQYMDEDEE